jgi:hypothetical protein
MITIIIEHKEKAWLKKFLVFKTNVKELCINLDLEEKDIKNITEKLSNTIFKDLDRQMQGRVSTDIFLEKLAELSPLKRFSARETDIPDIEPLESIETTSDKILQRLKRLKDKAIFKDDLESVKDINW